MSKAFIDLFLLVHVPDTWTSSRIVSLMERASCHGCRVTYGMESSSKALFMGKAHSHRAQAACRSNIVAASPKEISRDTDLAGDVHILHSDLS